MEIKSKIPPDPIHDVLDAALLRNGMSWKGLSKVLKQQGVTYSKMTSYKQGKCKLQPSVKTAYLAWLRKHAPDLLEEYQRNLVGKIGNLATPEVSTPARLDFLEQAFLEAMKTQNMIMERLSEQSAFNQDMLKRQAEQATFNQQILQRLADQQTVNQELLVLNGELLKNVQEVKTAINGNKA